MTSKLLILILGISNLCAEKHIKGEPYDSILESDLVIINDNLTSSTGAFSLVQLVVRLIKLHSRI